MRDARTQVARGVDRVARRTTEAGADRDDQPVLRRRMCFLVMVVVIADSFVRTFRCGTDKRRAG